MSFLEGRHEHGSWLEMLAAGSALHRAIEHLSRPSFLEVFTTNRHLGSYDLQRDPRLVPEGHVHQRAHAFHLQIAEDEVISDEWLHWERSDGEGEPIEFRFHWVPVTAAQEAVGWFVGRDGLPLLRKLVSDLS
jgi:hypothetical protein